MKENMRPKLSWTNCITNISPTAINKILTIYDNTNNPTTVIDINIDVCVDNGFICILNCVDKKSALYKNINNYKGFIINIITPDILEKCCGEIPVYKQLIFSESEIINAPYINKALVSLECEYIWEKDYFSGSRNCLFCAKVVGTTINQTYFNNEGFVRQEKQVYIERLIANLNPNTGKPYSIYSCTIETKDS